jgi:hypothetical protein
MHDAEQEARPHRAHGDFGINAGASVAGAMEAGHLGAQPRRVEHPIDPHGHMVIVDQFPQRPDDEKLRSPALLPTRHHSLPSSDTQGGSGG